MDEEFLPMRLAKLREQKEVSAREMSLSLGLSEGYINKIENKRLNPTVSTMDYICEYLGVSLSEFFDEGNRYPECFDELIRYARKLNYKELKQITELVKIIVEKTNER